ncbi:TlpA family protein disulfide reductase [Pedobacter sp. GR22-6]|uniref:TlpA family protein disulfide reductase n=1 Tax=Pedobacter sp. GR22-6 TaxID=3127957 RepID=UPI00307DE3FA
MEQKKKIVTFSNLSTLVLVLFTLSVLFIPEVKGWMIGSLMKIGLFKANVPNAGKAEGKVLKILAPAQEAIFEDGAGKRLSLSGQRGKVIFINFWATWCPPCIAELPSVDALRKKLKDSNVVFLMVDVDGKYAESNAFMSGKGFELPVYVPAGNIPRDYFGGSMPTTVILDRSGNMVFQHVGAADYNDPQVLEFINKL